MRNWRKWVWLVVTALISLVLFSGCNSSVISEKLRLVNMVRSVANQKEASFSVGIDIDGQRLKGQFFWITVGDEPWYGISVEGLQVYLHDEVLYFDQGRGYDLSGYTEDFPVEPGDMIWGLLLADLLQEEAAGKKSSYFTLSDDLYQSASRLFPELVNIKDILLHAELEVTEQDGKFAEFALFLEEGTVIRLVPEVDVPSIPTDLLMDLMAVSPIPAKWAEPLIRGAVALAEQEALGADVRIKLECGPLPLEDQAQMYCTEGTVWFVRNSKAYALSVTVPEQTSQMALGLAVSLCRNGQLLETPGGMTQFTLTADTDQLSELLEQLLPEVSDLDLHFEDAVFRLTASKTAWESIELTCSGYMPFFIAELPIRFTMKLDLMEGTVTLPEQIR